MINETIVQPDRPTSCLLGFDPRDVSLIVGIHKEALPRLVKDAAHGSNPVKKLQEDILGLPRFVPFQIGGAWGFGACMTKPIVSVFGHYHRWTLPLKTEFDPDTSLKYQTQKIHCHYAFTATLKLLLDCANRCKAEQNAELPRQDLHIDLQLSIGQGSCGMETIVSPCLKTWLLNQEHEAVSGRLEWAAQVALKQMHHRLTPNIEAKFDPPEFLGLGSSSAKGASLQGSLKPEVPILKSHNLDGPSQILPFVAALSDLCQWFRESQ